MRNLFKVGQAVLHADAREGGRRNHLPHLVLLLASAVTALAQTTPPASYKDLKYPPLKEIQIPKVAESTLPNGLKIYLLENHELPLVRGLALVRTGNLFDPADKIGLAGTTGALIRSGGTTAKTGDQLDEELENIAASVESSIGESYGSVSFSTLKERTDEVLGAFHDVLTSPAFREDKLDLIKTQTRGGIARRNDDAHGISQREFASLVYGPKTPYGWEEEYATIDNIKRDDVAAFYKRYFFPANIILAVQGDFSAPEMKAKLEKLFASWNATQPPVPSFPPVDPKLAAPGIHLVTKTDVTQTSLVLGHLGGILSDKDYPALEVMSDILGGGFQSRLFQKVRTQLGYAYEVSASWGADYDHPGIFEIGSSTKSASTTETLKAIDAEVQRIRTSEVTADELESAKQTVVNGFIFNFDTPSKTLNRLLTYRYYRYPDDFIFQYQKAIQQVTRADVLRVAKQYLDPAKFVIVAVGNPKEFGTPLTSLGVPVSNLDVTIPQPKRAAAEAPAGPAQPKGAALLAKMAQAMGGSAKLSDVKDMTQKAELNLDPAAGGLKVTQNEFWIASGHYREENVLPFGKVMTYSDGKAGWVSSPQGVAAIPDAERKQVSFEIFRTWFPLLASGADGSRTIADEANGAVRISDKAGNSLLLTIDPATGLPLSENYSEAGSSGSDVMETYGEWQETNGVKLPRKITIAQNGKHFADVKVNEVTINGGLTPEQLSKKP
ncbi:MAG TPA: pitrilysin family protein [Bryobacteraceae bacterium]|nr:pitrilysin family protein [Bryobacteraceae bacterium]